MKELDEVPIDVKSDNRILDFATERSTSWKNVKRVVIKEFEDEKEASRRVIVKDELLYVAKEYITKNCDRNGRILKNNISKKDEEIIQNLKSRVDKENLTIYQTDKTDKFVMDSLYNYEQKMQKHLANDTIVSDKEIRKMEHKINSETT